VTQPGTGLPADVVVAVRQLADQLHNALHAEMLHADPAPEVALLWQAAKLINGAAGGLDFGEPTDASDRHFVQWYDVADMASDIANAALGIAAAGMSTAEAVRRVESADVDAVDGFDSAAAFAATVEVTPPNYDDIPRTLTVSIAGDPGRTLSVTAERGPAPQPRPYTAATLLRVAHHLHRLGAVLGDVVEADAAPQRTP
jgi:hypothetical protein